MTAQNDTPHNELESSLIAGAMDQAARPRFYETLLRSQVLVVPIGEAPTVVDGLLQGDTKLSFSTIEIDGKYHVPFFSSESRLPSGTTFIRLSAVDFFKITSGSHLILNPGSNYGKVFFSHEVASLLNGSLFQPTETLTATGGERQLIGQPKDYPHDFSDAVSRFLSSEPGVEKAFLALHFIADVHTEPTILVAIIAPEVGFERMAAAIGVIAKETSKAEWAVDVIRLQENQLGYFSDQAPIYERKKKGLFAKFFG
ncbi:MAG: enhanced serine sensitivity protein SseB C-terminal domain-containing protein [Pseudomonas sp.]